MKQKDIATILIVVVIAGIASYFISTKLFVKSEDTKQELKKVEVISTEFTTPSSDYYNQNSVNPTQVICIGDQKVSPTCN